ncbi:MAG: VOC family protein [Candidatus Staskawiczbacteria bacterium]|jgi:catechol 2,3-dioxygenase-like lactoylglutathione lyase family enzyme
MKAIRHFGIVVSDINKALHFYRDLLGLKIRIDALEKGEFIDSILGLKNVEVRTIKMSADDNSLIELLCYKSHPKKVMRKKEIYEIGASHPAFTVKNLDCEYKKLKERRIKFICPPQISPDGKAKVSFCYDPDGVPVELVEPLDKK